MGHFQVSGLSFDSAELLEYLLVMEVTFSLDILPPMIQLECMCLERPMRSWWRFVFFLACGHGSLSLAYSSQATFTGWTTLKRNCKFY